MNEKNYSEISSAMNFKLRPLLAGFVAEKLSKHFGKENWWQLGVLDVLYNDQKKNLPTNGTYTELTDKLDIYLCTLLIDIHWWDIFVKSLPYDCFNYVKELQAIRNSWAHNPEVFDDEKTMRALDTMTRISKEIDEEVANELREKWQEKVNRINKPVKVELPKNSKTAWRNVIVPNEDVAAGRYKQSEFAADLGQVVRGEGSSEYAEPVEFFSRTYLTSGLKTLLVETLKRLSNGTGEPVIQLKTSFGGGKTHSLLALYHLFGGKIQANQSAAVREVLNAAKILALPKVHKAVVVGTWENPLSKTLWGTITEQLARSTGKPELYEMIRENDEKGIAPGVELLKKIFDAAGSCLILIDEIVAYGRKLSLGKIKSGGTFGNLMSFIQELTEAAKASAKTAVVVSIPESDAEIVDDLGRKVLTQVEKYFGRVEFVWTPITVNEGYEIIRRRLFKPCRDEKTREEVCAAFFSMYLYDESDFPFESRQSTYKEKLLACYPIHPKLFDFLYDKWTGLEGFQKTRGVLRLMANMIYHLWTNNDTSALIMPCNIPINFPPVRDELAKLLGGNWDAIINAEIDGDQSKPKTLDDQNYRLGNLTAARKIARTIFMGTAPESRKNSGVRGVLESEIRLGVIQPDEVENISTYNDALSKLKANLYYLYSQDTRLWFGVNPTLRKYIDDKRGQFSDAEIDDEIIKKLKSWRGQKIFKAVHTCPKQFENVPDEQTARLVILSPKYPYVEGTENNAAFENAKQFLENKTKSVPRSWKNMLVFMAAESENLRVLKDTVREYLAWSAVIKESRHLNLDSLQIEDANNNFKVAKENFAMKTSQAYCKIFAPKKFEDGKLNYEMQILKIECTKEDNIPVAAEKFVYDHYAMIFINLGIGKLRYLLDTFIWSDKDDVKIQQLWEYFATYYYLPRLVDENILFDAVRKGVEAKTFALAKDFQDGKYIELKFGEKVSENNLKEYFLVKAEVAQRQLNAENPTPPIDTETVIEKPPIDTENKIVKPDATPPPLPKHFSMNVELDNVKYVNNFKKYMDEVAKLVMNLPNARPSIRLVVNIDVPDGIAAEIQEIVEANCQTLKISKDDFHFK